MKVRVFHIILFLFCLAGPLAWAQLSPGPLAAPHAHLEGLSNCTKCHELGQKVPNEKCLACHQELEKRIRKNEGYHVSPEVKSKSCFSCHSDHHGLKFEIVRFDKQKFDHRLTGYPLTGSHQKTECASCHKPENIREESIRKKDYTYLGLDDRCISCHEDVHKKTLSGDCASCHNTTAFSPAALFDHHKTKFPLKGKHQDVDCASCHKIEQRDGARFQHFANLSFNQCSACHEDAHRKNFGPNCSSCHTEQSFAEIRFTAGFNHNVTDFSLKGKHRELDCKACHHGGFNQLSTAFQEFAGQNPEKCTTCHEDVHDNKFGQNCIQCHTEQSFKLVQAQESFNHDNTGFRLEGAHRQVDCKNCHKAKLIDPVPHDRCMDCHGDYHQKQFVKAGVPTDCGSCHNVQDFKESTYTLEQHQENAFPLLGAHQAVPCLDCHKKDTSWRFKNIGSRCMDCHQDIHRGLLDEKFYSQKECKNCHSEETWSTVHFDHDRTAFALKGKHVVLKCNACHLDAADLSDKKRILFDLPSADCASCHRNVHLSQFERNGITDCERCHGFDDWTASKFDHDQAAFKLDGAHKKVACEKCHKPIVDKGVTLIQYKMVSFRCIDCHL